MTALEIRAVDVPRSTELLRGLERQEIDVILAAARLRRFRASSVITHQGDPADQLFLLWKGRARYFVDTPNGKKLILIWVTPGHIFGAAALATPPFGNRSGNGNRAPGRASRPTATLALSPENTMTA